jgi:beta-phosphoglucomutase
VFEDAVLGVEAAKKAAMKCVGIDRYDNPQRLSKADIVVSDLSEIGFSELKGLFL